MSCCSSPSAPDSRRGALRPTSGSTWAAWTTQAVWESPAASDWWLSHNQRVGKSGSSHFEVEGTETTGQRVGSLLSRSLQNYFSLPPRHSKTKLISFLSLELVKKRSSTKNDTSPSQKSFKVKKNATNSRKKVGKWPASARGQCSCQGAEAQSASALWLDLGIRGKHLSLSSNRGSTKSIGEP